MDTETSTARRRLVRWVVVLAIVVTAAALAWPRTTRDCTTYGRAADYQSTPATLGSGVTCLR